MTEGGLSARRAIAMRYSELPPRASVRCNAGRRRSISRSNIPAPNMRRHNNRLVTAETKGHLHAR